MTFWVRKRLCLHLIPDLVHIVLQYMGKWCFRRVILFEDIKLQETGGHSDMYVDTSKAGFLRVVTPRHVHSIHFNPPSWSSIKDFQKRMWFVGCVNHHLYFSDDNLKLHRLNLHDRTISSVTGTIKFPWSNMHNHDSRYVLGYHMSSLYVFDTETQTTRATAFQCGWARIDTLSTVDGVGCVLIRDEGKHRLMVFQLDLPTLLYNCVLKEPIEDEVMLVNRDQVAFTRRDAVILYALESGEEQFLYYEKKVRYTLSADRSTLLIVDPTLQKLYSIQ
jgi:hypothetical protein